MAENKPTGELQGHPDGPADQAAVDLAATRTAVELAYQGVSQLDGDAEHPRLSLFGNLNRPPVFLDGTIKNPLPFREALATIYTIVGSDFRYAPKDRTAYHAYRRMKNQTANLGAWQAQQAYFDWLAQNDPYAFCVLDPVITVDPKQVLLEVFSKDEGTYANLSFDLDAFDLHSEPVCGTTNIDFSEPLFSALEQLRSYRETRVTIGQQAVAVATDNQKPVVEKKINVPDSWIRGFLQVQSSAMLPRESFKLSPMNLYNLLRQLRLNKDIKGQRRGVRVELVPGERPRLVLEPWGNVIECGEEIYRGRQASVTRIWGRRRLLLLRRMLPLINEIEVHMTGSGLPSFWVLRGTGMTLTLGLTGFNASNWSQAVQFDLLMPRVVATEDAQENDKPLAKVIKHLSKCHFDQRESIAKATKLSGEALVTTLQQGCQSGQLMFDVAGDVYRLRPLTDQPLVAEKYEYRNRDERVAHDLVLRKGAVKITTENRIFGSGLELTGLAKVNEDRREYRTQLLISDEGFVSRAECTCAQFRQQGLKAGPCPHLIALRMAHVIRERHRREGTADGDDAISVETRTYTKRVDQDETIYQVTLDQSQLKIQWSVAGQSPRMQQFRYPDVGAAREDYRRRLEALAAKGFLDATG